VWPTIERIVALSHDWNAMLILSWANPDTDSYQWLKAKAEREHIPFADWASGVESVRASMPDLPISNPHSGGHWRPWVNNVIARTYAREMGARPKPASEAAAKKVR